MASQSDSVFLGAVQGQRLTSNHYNEHHIGEFFDALRRREGFLLTMGVGLQKQGSEALPDQAVLITPLGTVTIRALTICDRQELSAAILFTSPPEFPKDGDFVRLLALRLSQNGWADESGKIHVTHLGQLDLGSLLQLLQARQLRANTELYESFLRAPV